MTSTVPPGRGRSASPPGTSCLATIVLYLRDENHSPIEAPRIKVALMGLQPWEPSNIEAISSSEGSGSFHPTTAVIERLSI
jgi:hypothetical protein